LSATDTASGTETTELVRRRYQLQLRRAEAEFEAGPVGTAPGGSAETADRRARRSGDADIVRAAMTAERQRLSALRAEGTIGDAAFQQVEEELDWAELDLQQFLSSEQ